QLVAVELRDRAENGLLLQFRDRDDFAHYVRGAYRRAGSAMDDRRQVGNGENGAAAQRTGPLQAVLKLAHIAGPIVAQHRLQCVVAERMLLAGGMSQLLQNMPGE